MYPFLQETYLMGEGTHTFQRAEVILLRIWKSKAGVVILMYDKAAFKSKLEGIKSSLIKEILLKKI